MEHEQAFSARLTAFFELERRDDLFAFMVDGWSAWRVLRNPLHRLTEALPLAQPVRANASRVLSALGNTVRLAVRLLTAQPCECLVKTCRSGLRMQAGDRFRDVYFDGLLATGKPYFKLEEINCPDFERQASLALFPPHLDSVVFTFWGKVLARLRPVTAAGPFCETLAGTLKNEVGIQVSAGWLQSRISTAYWQSRLYALLLKRLRPKAVLVSDTGEYGLIIACKRLGIRLIELQHGVFDAAHPDAIPAWVGGTAAQLLLPDVLACRGDYWIDRLADTRQGRDHAHAVGSELIDAARTRRALRVAGGPRRIVLSSQGLDSERLAQWIEAFAATAPSDIDWQLTIKLHPIYDAQTTCFDALAANPRIKVIHGSALPNIYDLIADSDLHLSIASACHFDAAALAVPSGIVPLTGHESMLDAVDERLIFLVRQPSAAWILPKALSEEHGYPFSSPGFVRQLSLLAG